MKLNLNNAADKKIYKQWMDELNKAMDALLKEDDEHYKLTGKPNFNGRTDTLL